MVNSLVFTTKFPLTSQRTSSNVFDEPFYKLLKYDTLHVIYCMCGAYESYMELIKWKGMSHTIFVTKISHAFHTQHQSFCADSSKHMPPLASVLCASGSSSSCISKFKGFNDQLNDYHKVVQNMSTHAQLLTYA